MARFNIEDDYYEDEIREGFYIPAAIKQAFAAELMVLNEIDRVCKNHGIKYFADWGTFLGAVRHGGFVPWDDDLDICMLRDDYNKFCKIAMSELPEEFEVYNLETRDTHKQFLANVVNSSRISFEKDYLQKYHGFPFVACVDIFVLDYMSNDPKKQELMCSSAKLLLKLSDDICAGNIDSEMIKKRLKEINQVTGIEIAFQTNPNELRRKLDIKATELFASFPKENAKNVVQMMPWGLNSTKIMPACCYADSVDLPFEMGTIPVPLNYDYILRMHYNDYMVLYKNTGAHGYPYFIKQKKDFINQFDIDYPEFRPNVQKILEEASAGGNGGNSNNTGEVNDENTKMTYKETILSCIQEIERIVGELPKEKDINDETLDKLQDFQQLLIDLGTYIEAIKGENYDLIKLIEELCEKIYLYATSEEIQGVDLISSVAELKNKLSKRTEAVFLCVGGKYFEVYRKEYEKLMSDEDVEVSVIPLPVYYKNYDGSLRDMKLDYEEYDKLSNVCKYDEYEYEIRHPEKIYFQFPFDEFNETLSVPPYFYSRNLRNVTEELIYIPYLNPDEFNEQNKREYANLKYYVCMPGVVYASRVIVPTENMRANYIGKLAEWLPEIPKEFWEKRIEAFDVETQKNCEMSFSVTASEKKTVLYYIEVGYLLRLQEDAIRKIKNSIDVILSAGKLNLIIVVDEVSYTKMKTLVPEEIRRLQELVEEKGISLMIGNREKYADCAKECDAFFGDAGLAAHLFRNSGKPVMIQDYSII